MVILSFAAVYIIWSSTFVAIKWGVDAIPPMLMAGMRFLVAGAGLFAFLLLRRVPVPSAAQWRSGAFLGVIMLAIGNGAVTWSSQHIPTGFIALLGATVPMWMTLLPVLHAWIKRRNAAATPSPLLLPSRVVIAGLIIGGIGTAVLVWPRLFPPAGSPGAFTVNGVIATCLILCSCVTWSVGSVVSHSMPRPQNLFMMTATQMISGGIALVLLSLLTGEAARFSIDTLTWRAALSWAYLVVFGSLVGFSAYVWLLQVQPHARVATYAYVNPVLALFFGWLVLDEQLNARTLVAAAIIIVGVALVITFKDRRTPEEDDEPGSPDLSEP